MKTVTKSNAETTLNIPAKYANTPVFVVACQNALKTRPLSEAAEWCWAASHEEREIAKYANAGADVLVVAMADGEAKGTFLVDKAWVRKGLKQNGQTKERYRLFFKFKSQLLGDYEVKASGKAPRRGISLL